MEGNERKMDADCENFYTDSMDLDKCVSGGCVSESVNLPEVLAPEYSTPSTNQENPLCQDLGTSENLSTSCSDDIIMSCVDDILPDIDLYLECMDDPQYVMPQSSGFSTHSLIGKNVQWKISFPHEQTDNSAQQPRKFKCTEPDCKKAFSREPLLKQHLATKHGKQMFFECSCCSFVTNSNRNLLRHIRRVHRGSDREVASGRPTIEKKERMKWKHVDPNSNPLFSDNGNCLSNNLDKSSSVYDGTNITERDRTTHGDICCVVPSRRLKDVVKKGKIDRTDSSKNFDKDCLNLDRCRESKQSICRDYDVTAVQFKKSDAFEHREFSGVDRLSSSSVNLSKVYSDNISNPSIDSFVNKANLKTISQINTKLSPVANHPVTIDLKRVNHSSEILSEVNVSRLSIRQVAPITVKKTIVLDNSAGIRTDNLEIANTKSSACENNSHDPARNSLSCSPVVANLTQVNHEDRSVSAGKKSDDQFAGHLLLETLVTGQIPQSRNHTVSTTSPGDQVCFKCKQCDFACVGSSKSVSHCHTMFAFCPLCSKVFSSVTSLKKHQTKLHPNGGIKRRNCPHPNCTETFQLKYDLKRHTDAAHFETGYACSHPGCKKTFRKSRLLRKHMLCHSELYACSWAGCGKSFRDKFNLETHLSSHTGMKSRACLYCDYRCVQKSALDWHMMKKHHKQHKHGKLLSSFVDCDDRCTDSVYVEIIKKG